jgi:hypothetical protein
MASQYSTPFRLFLIAASLALTPCSAMAEYISEDMCVIAWGDASDQLKISGPSYDYLTYPPGDSGDGWEDIGGPERGIADGRENLYFLSTHFVQLKGFGPDGHLIFDYSKDAPGYNKPFFDLALRRIYVDSLSRIYIQDELRDHIAVVDTASHLLQQLTPHRVGQGVEILEIFPGSDDALTLRVENDIYFTYARGAFNRGGTDGWLARDGYWYFAALAEASIVSCRRFERPNPEGVPSNQRWARIPMEDFAAEYGDFLGIDDEMKLYVYLAAAGLNDNRILIIDTSFTAIDQFSIPWTENKYLCYLPPFMRPSDGNIYEFRCLDDGLHVVRWRRK